MTDNEPAGLASAYNRGELSLGELAELLLPAPISPADEDEDEARFDAMSDAYAEIKPDLRRFWAIFQPVDDIPEGFEDESGVDTMFEVLFDAAFSKGWAAAKAAKPPS